MKLIVCWLGLALGAAYAETAVPPLKMEPVAVRVALTSKMTGEPIAFAGTIYLFPNGTYPTARPTEREAEDVALAYAQTPWGKIESISRVEYVPVEVAGRHAVAISFLALDQDRLTHGPAHARQPCWLLVFPDHRWIVGR